MRAALLIACMAALPWALMAEESVKESGKGKSKGAVKAQTKSASKEVPEAKVEPPPRPVAEMSEEERDTEARLRASQALEAFTKNDLVVARRDFRRVLELVPGNALAMINLGLVELRQKNHEEARKLLRELVRRSPENGVGWLVLGTVELETNQLDAALAAFAQAVLWEPKDARTHYFLSLTLGKKGWYSGAEEEMRKAIDLNPKDPDAHYNLAVFYLQRAPAAVELARRHYFQARELGAAPDADLEKRYFKEPTAQP